LKNDLLAASAALVSFNLEWYYAEEALEVKGDRTTSGGGSAAGHTPLPERSTEDAQGAGAEPALQLGEPPLTEMKEAKGTTAAGGGNSDTAGHAPPPEEIVMGYTQLLWGKF
jgi:hypothetical protein